jgi:hypothetical protein
VRVATCSAVAADRWATEPWPEVILAYGREVLTLLFWASLAVSVVAPPLIARRWRLRLALAGALVPALALGLLFVASLPTAWGRSTAAGDVTESGALLVGAILVLLGGLLGLGLAFTVRALRARS